METFIFADFPIFFDLIAGAGPSAKTESPHDIDRSIQSSFFGQRLRKRIGESAYSASPPAKLHLRIEAKSMMRKHHSPGIPQEVS